MSKDLKLKFEKTKESLNNFILDNNSNIIGIGTDIILIPRIKKLLNKFGSAFVNRILSAEEKIIFSNLKVDKHANYLSKRFAAKEAISKAIGTGIGETIKFEDISILNNALGKPFVKIHSSCLNNLNKVEISLSDDYPIAIAFAIIH